MKIFFEEYKTNYEEYAFGYKAWAEMERKEEIGAIYEMGFLPYSGESDRKNLFYLARSLRVDLKKFKPNSENKRISKKINLDLKREAIPIDEFNIKDDNFLDFCNKYFKGRHGINILKNGKFERILNLNILSHIVKYTNNEGEIVGYVFLASDKKMTHFWFSFYDLIYVRRYFGLWMMLNEILEAQKQKKEFMYLGTCYGEKALYKTNFDFIQWWTGEEWSEDKKLLKTKARQEI